VKDIVLAQTIGSMESLRWKSSTSCRPAWRNLIMGAAPSATVSRVIMEMADADDRIPIVRYASSDPERATQSGSAISWTANPGRSATGYFIGLVPFLTTAGADMIVGADKRGTPYYSLVYRSLNTVNFEL
jgi:hypothetical protein